MGDRWLLSLLLLATCMGLLKTISALRCRTEDGPSSDEVRKAIQTCMKRISSEAENKSSDESYDSYDSYYSDASQSEENNQRDGKQANNQRGNGRDHGDGDKNGDRNSNKNGGNHQISNRDRKEDGRQPERDYGYDGGNNGRFGRYKRQYYNDNPNNGYGNNGYQQNMQRYDRDRNNFQNSNGKNFRNASDNVNRDRACLMQCFFQELKMTNNEGFPDKHRVLHVITKDLRDNELRDFYTDSIQECFHMVGMDTKLKDKCDYSMKFVTCLADRGRANCNDWDTETIVF